MENKYTVQGEGWECKTVFIWIINQDKLKTNDYDYEYLSLWYTHSPRGGDVCCYSSGLGSLFVCLFSNGSRR